MDLTDNTYSMLDTSGLRVQQEHLPKDDFPHVGVCFRERELEKDQHIDTLIIHSCYLASSIISPPDKSLLTEFTENRARELAAIWVATKAAQQGINDPKELQKNQKEVAAIEASAIHTLIVARLGNGALTQFNPHAMRVVFEFYGFTAHYLIDRDGVVHEHVPTSLRAFHSGKSKMPRSEDGREGVSQFSIGVELVANHESGYTEPQLQALVSLTRALSKSYPLRNFYGHNHIAPERKTDPWLFDWQKFLTQIGFDPKLQFAVTNTKV